MSDHPLNRQVGGSHYQDLSMQPIEFIAANRLGFEAGCILKYLVRNKSADDFDKIGHYIDFLESDLPDRQCAIEQFCEANGFGTHHEVVLSILVQLSSGRLDQSTRRSLTFTLRNAIALIRENDDGDAGD